MIFDKIVRSFKQKKNNIFPSMNEKMRLYYAEHYESQSIDNKLIIYETRDGKSIVDSPYAMFLELASNPKYNSFKHIWIIDKGVEGIETSIPEELRGKVSFVERGTIEYVDALLRAKYLLSNSTLESFFVKKNEQIYINTWHGTPLKNMGFDIPGYVNQSQNVLRNFLMTDFLISPNAHTSAIFINSYKLKGIYPGQILEGGYPRIDLTLNSEPTKVIGKLKKTGLNYTSDLPLLLFSPTWKGSSVNDAEDDVDQIINETLMLVNKFSGIYNVLVKVHPFIFDKVDKNESISPYLVSNLMDANEVLAVTDILVTDYSSIFFDFLVTKKPIIFYSWDRDLYEGNRGMYLLEDDLPGPTAENINELIDLINHVSINAEKYQKKYELLAKKMTNYDDGNVTKKYIEYIFENKMSEKIKVHEVDSDKKKIIIYPGGMKNNGITSSLLNLVNNIDYSLYDVTVITNSTRNDEINNNLRTLNSNARVLFRFGKNILTKQELKIDRKFMDNGVSKDERKLYPELGYRREMNRLVGNLSFDVAIDFSGYSYFWGRHILGVNSEKFIAFMHNDLLSDSMREINGTTPMKKDLDSLFTIYYQFDKLLSVSPMTRDVNLKNLEEFVKPTQMSYVYNSINIEQILNPKETTLEQLRSMITIEKKFELVRETGKVFFYKNVDAIKEKKEMPLSLREGDKVVNHATFIFENTKYCKVSIEGIYIGWIDSDYLVPRILDVSNVNKYHAYGTVSRGFNFPIWKEIRRNSESDQIVTYAGYFKHRYLEVTHEAITDNGRYFLVKYNGKKVGWMSSRPLMRIHRVDPLNLLQIRFRKKMKKMDQISPVVYSDKVEVDLVLYTRLKRDIPVSLWEVPSLVLNSMELPISEEYFEVAFKISEKVYFENQVHCKLTFEDGSFVGYIDQVMLEFIDKKLYLEINHLESQERGLDILPKIDLAMQKVPKFDSTYINFVNMGRLSPEKNQDQLIIAFKQFNEEIPNSRLYILGKGPLQKNLIELIRELKLEGKVVLLGHISNPFEFMKLNSYFVLPSFYEGQPMVLLESLTIGMNILASNIPANINVIGKDEEYGLLIDGTTIDAIYKGLKRAYEFKGNFTSFDCHEYNKNAINNFYREIS